MAQELGKTFEKYLWGDLILVKFQTFAFNFTTLLSIVLLHRYLSRIFCRFLTLYFWNSIC